MPEESQEVVGRELKTKVGVLEMDGRVVAVAAALSQRHATARQWQKM